jgi:hypothetical protein
MKYEGSEEMNGSANYAAAEVKQSEPWRWILTTRCHASESFTNNNELWRINSGTELAGASFNLAGVAGYMH